MGALFYTFGGRMETKIMINIAELTFTSLETIDAFDIASGDFLYSLDELQNGTIAQTEDKQDITGKNGRKITSIKRNKAVTVTAASGMVVAGAMESQTGSKFEQKDALYRWTDYLTVSGNEAVTSFKAVGTAGNEVPEVYIHNSNGTVGKKFTQDTTAGDTTFTYDPETKKLVFGNGAIEDGSEIVVRYDRKINAPVLTNYSDKYAGKAMLYVNALAEDKCGAVYLVQYRIPKSDISGNLELQIGDNQTVHNFEAEALAGSCGTAGEFYTLTIIGADAEDVA